MAVLFLPLVISAVQNIAVPKAAQQVARCSGSHLRQSLHQVGLTQEPDDRSGTKVARMDPELEVPGPPEKP